MRTNEKKTQNKRMESSLQRFPHPKAGERYHHDYLSGKLKTAGKYLMHPLQCLKLKADFIEDIECKGSQAASRSYSVSCHVGFPIPSM